MSVFKRRRFPAEIILLCVRWYCRYGISYRDLEEMMAERGALCSLIAAAAQALRGHQVISLPGPLFSPGLEHPSTTP